MIYRSQHTPDLLYEMISDKKRNQFYEQILQSSVAGKNCIDVGFGSGILSFLALKHGAKHITAFEVNPDTYLLGEYLIKKLKLENYITLHNTAFDEKYIEKEHDILFHELLDCNLWGEGVFYTFNNNLQKIPSKYICEFYFCELSDQETMKLEEYSNLLARRKLFKVQYDQIKGFNWPECQNINDIYNLPIEIQEEIYSQFPHITYKKFDPGVDVDNRYVEGIEEILQNYLTDLFLDSKIHYLNNDFFGEGTTNQKIMYHKYLKKSKIFASYILDVNSHVWVDVSQNKFELDLSKNFIDLVVDHTLLSNKNFLILPRYSIEHHGNKIYLDNGHWAVPSIGNVIVKNIKSNLYIRSYFSKIYDKNTIKFYTE